MKKITVSALLFCLAFAGYGQIEKENWLVGGSASFSSLKNSSTAAAQFNQTNIQVSPMIGYFLKDKFAVGLKPSLTYASNNIANTNTIINVRPFMRYYFLKTENIFNLFAEGNYSYGSISGKGETTHQNLNTFSFCGGPVLYFNSAVGLEFLITYSTTKIVGFSGNNNEIRFGVGFQIHLEKKK